MKRIIVDWNGNTDYLLMLLTFVGCEIKAGKTNGVAHGHNWHMQDDGASGESYVADQDGAGY